MRLTSFLTVFSIVLILAPTVASPLAAATERAAPLIIDHTCTDLADIPAEYIEMAKDQLFLTYSHSSHGSQILTGMQVLMDDPDNDGLYDFNNGAIVDGVLSIDSWHLPGILMYEGWAEDVREFLSGVGSIRNVAAWSWCGELNNASAAYVNDYLSIMAGFEVDHPDVTFVYMTGHLNCEGSDDNLHQRNEQIRAYCLANSKVLFDFADIERYDPDGTDYLDLGACDNCNYDGGNWAQQWCDNHPGSDLCISCDCAHSEPLNCNLKARAFWWMMARIAGWEPAGVQTVACDLACQPAAGTLPFPVRFTATLTNSYSGFARCLSGHIDVDLPGGTRITRWRAGTATIGAGQSVVTVWTNSLPANQMMAGLSSFILVGVDVTPAPYNQPPYPPSGTSDADSCTVNGMAP